MEPIASSVSQSRQIGQSERTFSKVSQSTGLLQNHGRHLTNQASLWHTRTSMEQHGFSRTCVMLQLLLWHFLLQTTFALIRWPWKFKKVHGCFSVLRSNCHMLVNLNRVPPIPSQNKIWRWRVTKTNRIYRQPSQRWKHNIMEYSVAKTSWSMIPGFSTFLVERDSFGAGTLGQRFEPSS